MKNLILVMLTIVFLAACNSKKEFHETETPKTPEELKAELKMDEESNPIKYLEIDGKMHDSILKTREESFFHNAEFKKIGTLINGTIKNKASVAKFKDAVMKVSYYSATNTEISSETHTMYQFYEPNSEKKFSVMIKKPEETKGFGIEIIKATATN
jgi:hypothetical protein